MVWPICLSVIEFIRKLEILYYLTKILIIGMYTTYVCLMQLILEINSLYNTSQVGKSACIVLAKERHSKKERVPFSALS